MIPDFKTMAVLVHAKDHKAFEKISIQIGQVMHDPSFVMTIPGCTRCEEFAKERTGK